MTLLIARLILAMLILPLAATIIVLWMAALAGMARGQPPTIAFVLMWVVTDTFIVIYWVLLWRGMVRWTPLRRKRTVGAVFTMLGASVLFAALMRVSFDAPGFVAAMIGGGIGPIVWVLLSVLIWRETPAERVERLARSGADSVCCPLCGYNMTGLTESRCPECGGRFTLDQLLAAQREQGCEDDT